ncbi:hypothetical protein ACGF0J_07520 [Nonomuraea sp. NPDC047897]
MAEVSVVEPATDDTEAGASTSRTDTPPRSTPPVNYRDETVMTTFPAA